MLKSRGLDRPGEAIRVAGMRSRERFGQYDPATGRVTFWSRSSVSIPRIVAEVERIRPLVAAALDGPR